MKKVLFILFICFSAGFLHAEEEISLEHRIEVPEQFTSGCSVPLFCTSDISRYVDAYERAWWTCIKERSENINYQYSPGDIAGNGWPPSVAGWKDGYLNANKLIEKLIKVHGKEKVAAYLIHMFSGDWAL